MSTLFIILLTFLISEENIKANPKYKPIFYFSISQSISPDMQDIYGLYPSIGVGISSDFAPHKSFILGLDLIYDRGSVWDYEKEFNKEVDLTVLSLEAKWHFGTTPYHGANYYWGGGLILATGMEYIPYADRWGSPSGKSYSGLGLGALLFIGSHLQRLGDYSLGIEGRLKFLGILVSGKDWWEEYWYTYDRYSINLSGLSLVITLERWP